MKEHLDIYACDKAAVVIILAEAFPQTTIDESGRVCFRFPNTERVEKAMKDFFNDVPVPCKTFSDLLKSLKSQMFVIKNHYGNGSTSDE